MFEEKLRECINSAKTTDDALSFSCGRASYARSEIRNLHGKIQLQGSSSFIFLPEDTSYLLKCTVVDIASHLMTWMQSVGRPVILHKCYILVERFVIFGGKEHNIVSLQIRGDALELLEPEELNRITSSDLDWTQKIAVHHVSVPVFIQGFEVFCFVLAILELKVFCDAVAADLSWPERQSKGVEYLSDSMVLGSRERSPVLSCRCGHSHRTKDHGGKAVWLVLKGGQVAWRELLLPNREYRLVLPASVDKNYFEECKDLLNVIDNKEVSRYLQDIVHHPELWPTLQATCIPCGTVVYMTRSSYLSRTPFNSAVWLNINEAENADERIVSIYGRIKSMQYSPALNKVGCCLCKPGTKKSASVMTYEGICYPKRWTDPWKDDASLNDAETEILLPLASDDFDSDYDESFPEHLNGIVKEIVIQDLHSSETVTLYIKDWGKREFPFGLCPGVVISAKFVNRRYSSKGNIYYTTCPLSSFQLLEDNSLSEDQNTSWGYFGFPYIESKPWAKLWGVLDLENLMKVSIHTVCTYCGAEYKHGRCSMKFCQPPYKSKIAATAVVSLDHFNKPAVTVMIKDDHVRILLGINQNIWSQLGEAASSTELFYLNKGSKPIEEGDRLQTLFQAYCKFVRPKSRFHICCRQFRSEPGEQPVYFCLHLEPVTWDRVDIMEAHFNSI